MIEKNLIIDKIKQGEQYCDELKSILPESYNEFMNQNLIKRSSERLFEIISQVILDICTHIVSNLPVETPGTYSQCISILASQNILPIQEESKFTSLIKMRNLVTHQYGTINYELLFEGLKTLITDFEQYSKHIMKWLNQKDQGS